MGGRDAINAFKIARCSISGFLHHSELPQTRLWRYVEALERILALDPTLGGRAIDSEVTSHRYLLKGRGERFINVAVLNLEVLERPFADNY